MGTPPVQSPGGTGGGGTPPKRPLRDMVEDIAKATEAQLKLNKAIASGVETAAQIQRKTQGWATDLKLSLVYADDMEEKLRAIVDYQKNMSKLALNRKTYKGAKKDLEEFIKVNEAAIKGGFFSKAHEATIKQSLAVAAKGLAHVSAQTGKIGHDPVLDKYIQDMNKIGAAATRSAKAMKGMKLGGVSKEAAHLEKSFSHLFGKGGNSRIEKVGQYASQIHNMKEARQARRDSRKDLRDKIKQAGGLALDPDFKTARQTAREAGFGMFGSSYRARQMQGKGGGFLTNTMGTLAAGERGLQGVGMVGSSAVEGIAGAAGAMAIPLAVVAALYEAFAKNQEMNGKVHEALGKGGIYGGTKRPGEVYDTIRGNLNLDSGLGFNRFGVGYEKNLDLAKSMTEGGFNTTNLSDHLVGQDKNTGMLNNSFGSFQRNAYMYGKMAGLSPTETMTQTIKLMTQYKQSLKSTEAFFVQITKDTTAAGITTTKYIELIDEVNSHYDRSNKLLMTTVTTMRMLSSTGMQTADDLKESMGAITNNGKQMPLNQAAFLNTNMLQTEEGRTDLVNMSVAAQNHSLDNVARGMLPDDATPAQIEEKKKWLKEGVENGGATFANGLAMDNVRALRRKGDVKEEDRTAVANQKDALDDLVARTNDVRAAREEVQDTMHGEGAAHAGMERAFRTGTMGSTPANDAQTNYEALKLALDAAGSASGKKFSVSDYMKDPTAMEHSGVLNKYLEQFHFDKGWLPTIERLAPVMGDTEATAFAKGTDGMSEEQAGKMHDLEDRKYKELKAKNFDFKGNDTGNGAETMEKMARSGDQNQNDLANALGGLSTVMEDMFKTGIGSVQDAFNEQVTNLEKEKTSKDAANQTLNTTTLSTVLEAVFLDYFNKFAHLVLQIDRITDWMSGHLPGFRGDPTATVATVAGDAAGPDTEGHGPSSTGNMGVPDLPGIPGAPIPGELQGANGFSTMFGQSGADLLKTMNLDDPQAKHPTIKLNAAQEDEIKDLLVQAQKLHKIMPVVTHKDAAGNNYYTVTYYNTDATTHQNLAPPNTGTALNERTGRTGHDAANKQSDDYYAQRFHRHHLKGHS